jgi:hypothetical protein
MKEDRILTPGEAESVIADRIEEFGLDALPRVAVTALEDGRWRVRWQHVERIVAPMSRSAWCTWLEQNVGSLDAGDLQTTES